MCTYIHIAVCVYTVLLKKGKVYFWPSNFWRSPGTTIELENQECFTIYFLKPDTKGHGLQSTYTFLVLTELLPFSHSSPPNQPSPLLTLLSPPLALPWLPLPKSPLQHQILGGNLQIGSRTTTGARRGASCMWIGPSPSLPVALGFVADQGELDFPLLCTSLVFRVDFGHGNRWTSGGEKLLECCSSDFR